MGFYVRKSLKAGPFRFNLSRSGLGISAGVPGFRVGTGPRGNYVHMGTRGVYYRTSLDQKHRQHYLTDPHAYPAHPTDIGASEIHFVDVNGASPQQLTPTGADDLIEQLNQSAHRRPLTRWVVLAIVFVGLFTLPFGLLLWLLGIPFIWWVVQRDRGRRAVVVFYDVNDQHAQHFEWIHAAGTDLAHVKGIWRINESGALAPGHQRKVNAGAGALVRRTPVTISDHGPKHLVTNISVPSMSTGKINLYLLPDRILLEENRTFTDISYDAVRTTHRIEQFIESPAAIPSDSVQVGTTWQYVNLKGGPDRRFSNNPVLPVMRYARVELASSSGFRWILQISNTESAEKFSLSLQSKPLLVPLEHEHRQATLPAPPPVLPSPPLRHVPGSQPQSSPSASVSRPGAASTEQAAQWTAPDQSREVNGYNLARGFIYIGTLNSTPGSIADPALVDPDLPINSQHPDLEGSCLAYWPSYAGITPEGRAAFMGWLAGDRRHPSTPIGYVFIYFYGLERRVLVDIQADPSLARELPAIRTEVTELLEAYGEQSESFHGYASGFVEVIDFLLARFHGTGPAKLPALTPDKWPVPFALRAGLGSFAASGTRLPADWALAWAWYHPDIYPRTPVTRCPEEFSELFTIRFSQAFPKGMLLRNGKARMKITYAAASSAIRFVTQTLDDVPAVFEQKAAGQRLSELFGSVTNELDGYSRWLGRNPSGKGTLQAAALLPPELLESRPGEVDDFKEWVSDQMKTPGAPLTGADIMNHWPSTSGDKLGKPESVHLVQLLGHLNIGMEPDVRFGGPNVSSLAPIVLFEAGPDMPSAPTPAYGAAATMLHLAVAVAGSDGTLHPSEMDQLSAQLQSTLALTPAEKTRLQAHLSWLCATEIRLTGLAKRIGQLDQDQRAAIGGLMITIAAADGHIAAAEVTVIQKIYKLLGLDPESVTGKLHTAVTTPPPAVTPITVRPPGTPDTTYPLPGRTTAVTDPPASDPPTLDRHVMDAKLAETAAVSALLADIFQDDLDSTSMIPPSLDPAPAGQGAESSRIGNLDDGHSAFLRALADLEHLDRARFDDLAAEHGLLPDGALDVLNEAAMDASEEPLLEGSEILTINSYALKELLS